MYLFFRPQGNFCPLHVNQNDFLTNYGAELCGQDETRSLCPNCRSMNDKYSYSLTQHVFDVEIRLSGALLTESVETIFFVDKISLSPKGVYFPYSRTWTVTILFESLQLIFDSNSCTLIAVPSLAIYYT